LRKTIWIIAAVVLLAVAAAATGFIMMRGREHPAAAGAPIKTFSFSRNGSSTSEMSSYGVVRDRETGERTVEYDFGYGFETYSLPVDEAFLQELSAVIDSHNLKKWDGFQKSSSMVMDGNGFSLVVTFTEGDGIIASGSNKYPKGYREAAEAIEAVFLNYLKKNGIEPEWTVG